MIRKAVPSDVDAVAASYRLLLDHEAATHSDTNWKPGIYPIRQDAQGAVDDGLKNLLWVKIGKIISFWKKAIDIRKKVC